MPDSATWKSTKSVRWEQNNFLVFRKSWVIRIFLR